MSCPYFASESFQNEEAATNSNDPNAIPKYRYEVYLQLPKILSAQKLLSGFGGVTPVHDEHLFVIAHQTFELWFKQMLHEIDSARNIFDTEYLEERNMLVLISRINRVVEIIKLLTTQYTIMETMTPQDFFDFRDYVAGGSGFQSLQFRLLENKLGLLQEFRIKHNGELYYEAFQPEDRKILSRSEEEKSLFDLVNSWLERTPGLEADGFDFFTKFKFSVEAMFDEKEAFAKEVENPRERDRQIREVQKSRMTFNTIFDENIHKQLVQKGDRRFSHKAMQGALMIFMYRDEPRFHLPFQLLQCLTDVDEFLNKMRYVHSCMAQRMIGNKIGTGESSGYHYLRATCCEKYKIFRDFMTLSSFLVPRDRIPPLDAQMKRSLSVNDWNLVLGTKQGQLDTDGDSGVVSTMSRLIRRVSSSSLGTMDDKIGTYRSAGKPESTV